MLLFNLKVILEIACSKRSDSGERCGLSERLEQAILEKRGKPFYVLI